MSRMYTAVIYREDDGYVAICPDLDVASQGDTPQEARKNLKEAVSLVLECASPEELAERLHEEVYLTPLEVEVG